MTMPVYITTCLERFALTQLKPKLVPMIEPSSDASELLDAETASLYRSMTGALLFIANTARPDIAFSTAYAARSMSQPTVASLTAVKRIWAYLSGTMTRGIVYCSSQTCTRDVLPHFVLYVDSDWASDPVGRRSTTGLIFFLAGSPVFYASNKQSLVTLSSTESEYVALAEAGKEAIYIQALINDLNDIKIVEPLVIMEDNKGAIDLSRSPKFHSRTKHIDVRHHFIRDHIAIKAFKVEKVDTLSNLADGFTKPLTGKAFEIFASHVTRAV